VMGARRYGKMEISFGHERGLQGKRKHTNSRGSISFLKRNWEKDAQKGRRSVKRKGGEQNQMVIAEGGSWGVVNKKKHRITK